ncbi:MAG: RuBisCO large subunit C-terminal-like domain-containing protein [Candidatus Margulisiibacteriota bacterium]|jgi:ribulose-bisphosphate carboxylase large chain
MAEKLIITYQLACSPKEAVKLAKRIAQEQTIEMPEGLVADQAVKDKIIGRISNLRNKEKGLQEVKISYDLDIVDHQLPQLLNLLYGNISLFNGIKITTVKLPDNLLGRFPGPRFGVGGIRKLLKAEKRPLIAAATKPLGSSPKRLAELCAQFALGGIDIIKDDHSIADQKFCRFAERVKACTQTIAKAQKQTGKKTLYFPNVSARAEDLAGQIELARELGAQGVILSPFIIGLDLARSMIDRYGKDLIFMAHPAMAGGLLGEKQGIAHEILLGTLTRIVGFDSVIFPHYGGRFPFSRDECHSIALSCHEKLGNLRTSFPVPAGGLDIKHLNKETKSYGKDVILLMGSTFYARSADLADNVKYVMKQVGA